jgi:ectoine hydroxylase
MSLTDAEAQQFDQRGFLVRERAFSPAEVAVLAAALPAITAGGAHRVIDQASGTVRMVHGGHRDHPALGRLARHPRLLEPARRLLGGPVYLYQSRLNLKEGFRGKAPGGYPWHQDFSTWHLRDGLPDPRAVVVFTFLDDVTPTNAPLMVIPGSHRRGLVGVAERDPDDGAYRQVLIDPDRLAELADQGGVEAMTGAAGTVMWMHSNLVHGSTENISPRRRALFSVVYAAADNRPTLAERSERYAARDFTAVEPLADDCLAAAV